MCISPTAYTNLNRTEWKLGSFNQAITGDLLTVPLHLRSFAQLMPVAKLCTTRTLDPMRSSDGNEGIDTYIRQSIGKEPLLSFSRTGDASVQWFQLLNALDQQELPGWPLLTPLKVQMQKCEKCSREFCSPINYRRHIRVHRRLLKVDKESRRIRDMLAAFWDKLSLEEAKEVVSINDVMLKEVPGISVSKALAASLPKPGVWTLPQVYVKAGSTLLDIIHAKPSRLPISSQELFSVLDDASERTFLCAGTAESVQKYVFDGEAGKVAFDLKNLVSCTCFLFELKLLKAWLTDKDAEALRCQKLLMEEEEAAQKRRAELLERKRKKKLRQKEHKAREQLNSENVASRFIDSLEEESLPAETYCLTAPPEIVADVPEGLADVTHCPDLVQFPNNEQDDIEAHEQNETFEAQLHSNNCQENVGVQNVDQPMVSANIRRWWQLPKAQRNGRNGFHGYHNLQLLKPDPTVQKHAPLKTSNNNKVWAKKSKVEYEDGLRARSEELLLNQTDEKKCELLIGSISVPVRNYFSKIKSGASREATFNHSTEPGKHKSSNYEEDPNNSDYLQNGINRAAAKHWRPVSRHETRGLVPIQRCSEKRLSDEKNDDRSASDGCCQQSSALGDVFSKSAECFDYPVEGAAVPAQFSSVSAKAFLAQRWKEAISSDHVKLVLSAEPEPPGGTQTQNDFSVAISVASEISENSVLGNAESQVSVVGLFSSNSRNAKEKIRTNTDKSVKIKYIPKQKVAA